MIDDIKQAIENLTKERDRVLDEQLTTVAVLRSCRYLDFAHVELISQRYNDKISCRSQQIADLQENLKRLEAPQNAEN
ncbi:hypothetical protein [Clostridium minihomine]|uniref:hypothetical protein n=1 Tax=Clostridium minihomine TaxID=2045012 RepID=UPI000C78F060|nr:hypothetical protein [Clostridium minihomine]